MIKTHSDERTYLFTVSPFKSNTCSRKKICHTLYILDKWQKYEAIKIMHRRKYFKY